MWHQPSKSRKYLAARQYFDDALESEEKKAAEVNGRKNVGVASIIRVEPNRKTSS